MTRSTVATGLMALGTVLATGGLLFQVLKPQIEEWLLARSEGLPMLLTPFPISGVPAIILGVALFLVGLLYWYGGKGGRAQVRGAGAVTLVSLGAVLATGGFLFYVLNPQLMRLLLSHGYSWAMLLYLISFKGVVPMIMGGVLLLVGFLGLLHRQGR